MLRLSPQNKELTGEQKQDFCNALIVAYSTPSALDQMLQFNLSKRLSDLSLANDMPTIAFAVINKAEAEAWSGELLAAALKSNPDNPELLAFAQQFSSSDAPGSTKKEIQETQETRIRRLYQRYQKLVEFSSTTGDKSQIEGMIAKYRDMLVGYLQYYQDAQIGGDDFVIPKDIAHLIKKFPHPARMRRSSIYTKLQGARIIRIETSQMFRMIDLLINPETDKANKLRECFTDASKLRRMFNDGVGYSVGQLGELKPVLGDPSHNDRFWGPARPDLRVPGVQPLRFIPLQLSLSTYLNGYEFEPGSILDDALQGALKSIKNTQISGRLRIYPPGTGVVQMALTLTFRKQIHVELVAQIAKNIKDLLFVDPQGARKQCAILFFEVVDQVIQELGLDREAIAATRCWLPPETTFCIYDDGEFAPHRAVNKLAHLMDYATENGDDVTVLAERIEQALKSKHWLNDKILFTVGTKVALLIVAQTSTAVRQQSRDWLLETRELVSAAIYARLAFAERVEQLFKDRQLEERFDHEDMLPYLEGILHAMLQVIEAIGEVRAHLKRQGTGVLVRFAETLWQLTPSISDRDLSNSLSYLEEQMLSEQRDRPNTRLEAVIAVIHKLQKISYPRYITTGESASNKESHAIEQFEEQLLEDLREYDYFCTQTGV